MYGKEESAAGKKAFWTAFGRYMQPVPGADGLPKKWLNYDTGVPGIYLRLLLQNQTAYAGIELATANSERGRQAEEQLRQLMPALRRFTQEDWDWMAVPERAPDNLFLGTSVSGKSAVRQEDWPDLIAFFKRHIRSMDAFWEAFKPAFEMSG